MKIDTINLKSTLQLSKTSGTHDGELWLNFNPHNKVQCKHNTAEVSEVPVHGREASGCRAHHHVTPRPPHASLNTHPPPQSRELPSTCSYSLKFPAARRIAFTL